MLSIYCHPESLRLWSYKAVVVATQLLVLGIGVLRKATRDCSKGPAGGICSSDVSYSTDHVILTGASTCSNDAVRFITSMFIDQADKLVGVDMPVSQTCGLKNYEVTCFKIAPPSCAQYACLSSDGSWRLLMTVEGPKK